MRTMYTKSDDIKIMIGNETDEIIEKLFDSFFTNISRKFRAINERSEFVFDSPDLLFYKCHKISLNRGGLYIDSPKWFKNNKVTSHKNDWKRFESNNKSIALNILFVLYKSKEIRHPYKSKHNLNRENQQILLMITDDKYDIILL